MPYYVTAVSAEKSATFNFQTTSITRTLAKLNCFKFRFPSGFDELPRFYCGNNCIAAVEQIKRKAFPVFIEHVLSPT